MRKPKIRIILTLSEEEYEKLLKNTKVELEVKLTKKDYLRVMKRIREEYNCKTLKEFIVKYARGEIKFKKHKNKKLKI